MDFCPSVSVVVAVYNAAPFLERAVKSLQSQTFRDFEVLLVDDGSTDDSLALCQKVQSSDSRFQALSKPNGGVSSARNFGVDRAKGRYVTFMDNDDYVHPDWLKILYDTVTQQNAQVAKCGYWKAEEPRDSSTYPLPFSKNPQVTEERCYMAKTVSGLEYALDMVNWRTDCYVWNQLISRELCHKIRFPENKMAEDYSYCLQIGHYADTVAFCSECLYGWTQRSASQSHNYVLRECLDIAQSRADALEYLLKNHCTDLGNLCEECLNPFFEWYPSLSLKKWESRRQIEALFQHLHSYRRFYRKNLKSTAGKMKLAMLLYFPKSYYYLMRKCRQLRGIPLEKDETFSEVSAFSKKSV